MTTSLVDADSLLAVDVGSVSTRALLFDVAEGQYRFVAAGQAPTTAAAPFRDVNEGVRLAIERLQEITGRAIYDSEERLILPSRPDGSGVDVLVATLSTGPSLNIVVAGLLSDVSLESAQRLASSTYGRLVETIGLNDRRKAETQIDAMIRATPDVIILAGGTEGGATRSVTKLLEVVGLACFLLPQEKRPTVLYAGNQALAEKVKSSLEGVVQVQLAPNIRPAFDVEDLGPAENCLADIVEQIQSRQVGGVQMLSNLAAGRLTSTAHAFGRFVRFLSLVFKDTHKGILGLDLGASSTVVAAAFGGRLNLNVYPMGMGEGMSGVLSDNSKLEEITQWLTLHAAEGTVRDYLYHKSLYPASLPHTLEEIAIEQAVARQILRLAARSIVPSRLAGSAMAAAGGGPSSGGLAIPFEPILAAGSVLTQAPTLGQSLMMLLDGLQPLGVTTFFLDQNNLLSALGAACEVNTVLPVQIFESGAFLNLGTVVSPVSDARYGTPILRVRMVRDDNSEHRVEVKQGSFHALPLARGQSAQLLMEPLGHTSLGMNRPSRGIKIVGGALGGVIDARGRPLILPVDTPRRREMIKKWLWTLGG